MTSPADGGSIDDLHALPRAGDNGRVWVKAYTAADVFDALNEVARFDWKTFFEALNSKSAEIPRAGSREAATGSSTPRRQTCSPIPGRSTAA